MRGFQNNVIFSSKVLLASFKFRKCSKTFEFCERNVDFNKTILARGLNLSQKTIFNKKPLLADLAVVIVCYCMANFVIENCMLLYPGNFVIGNFAGTKYFPTLTPGTSLQYLIENFCNGNCANLKIHQRRKILDQSNGNLHLFWWGCGANKICTPICIMFACQVCTW